MRFIAGPTDAAVTVGGGADAFDFVAGKAGGDLTVAGFRVGVDSIDLQGYTGSGIASERVVSGALQVVLSDNSHITLLGITSTGTSLFS